MAGKKGRLKKAVGRLALDNGVIEARFNFSALEIKTIYAIALKIQEGQGGLNLVEYMKSPKDTTLYFTASELCKYIGINAKHYDRLEGIFDKIIRSVVTIRDGANWEKFSFLTNAKYDTGIVSIQPNVSMMPFYTNLTKNYTLLELGTVMKFKSSYSIRIYTLIKQFQNLQPYRKINIEELKQKLGVEKVYARMNNFKVYVLDVAKKEINELLPYLNFDYELVKLGRSYTDVRFHFDFSEVTERRPVKKEDVNLHMTAYACYMELSEGKECPIDKAPHSNKQCTYCIKKIKLKD